MRPDIERARCPGQGNSTLENTDANEYRRSELATQAQLVDLDDIRLQRAVARLHKLGPRPLFEMLIELGARHLLRTEIEAAVNRYVALDPELLFAIDADTLPPAPVHVVRGAR